MEKFRILLLFISCVFYSQAFTGDNPDISIKNNATIWVNKHTYTADTIQLQPLEIRHKLEEIEKGELYICNNTRICGISCLKNYEISKARPQNKNTHIRRRNPQVFTNKTPLPKTKKRVIMAYRDLYIFSVNGICSDLMTLNNFNNINKSKIIKESIYFSPELLIYSEHPIFPYYSSKLVSGLKFFAYCRPPPFISSKQYL